MIQIRLLGYGFNDLKFLGLGARLCAQTENQIAAETVQASVFAVAQRLQTPFAALLNQVSQSASIVLTPMSETLTLFDGAYSDKI